MRSVAPLSRPSRPAAAVPHLTSKVPEVTALFWIAKVLTTGMGETASDFLVRIMAPEVAVAIAGAAFLGAISLQFSSKRYTPWIYWSSVVMVSVFGTMVADAIHVILGVPYVVSVIAFSIALAAVLALWHRLEHTLSVHSINTRRREGFYWTTVLMTFALGTAVGDWTAMTLHLGFFASGVLFAVAIAIPGLAFGLQRLNAVAAFWWAYVLTRPLGASFADWIAIPPARGGLGWGTGWVTLGLGVAVISVVVHLQTREGVRGTAREVEAEGSA